MKDLIERQAAIDAIEFGITYAKAINKETGEVKELFQASNDELRKAADRIKQLPPAQPERKWIPCSERLPERYGWYLCTLKDGRVNCYYWNKKGEWVDNGKKHFFDLYNIRSRYTGEEINPEQEGSVYWTDWVIAWMPLPEPYKEGEGR